MKIDFFKIWKHCYWQINVQNFVITILSAVNGCFHRQIIQKLLMHSERNKYKFFSVDTNDDSSGIEL